MDQSLYRPFGSDHKVTFGELIQRCIREVLPTKKCERKAAIRLRAIYALRKQMVESVFGQGHC